MHQLVLFRAIVPIEMTRIYLDHQATTPVDTRVVEAMLPYFLENFGNAHANTYPLGLNARRATEDARRKIASSIGASPHNLIFTSGATESNNIALLGTANAVTGRRRRIVTQATEHRSVLAPVAHLAKSGFDVVTIGVKSNGIVDLEALTQAVDENTLLVSIMFVNNETGVIQPVEKVVEICSQVGALVHSDCAQALGKVHIDVEKLQLDLASVSAHKIYGPKGIGALYVKNLRRAAINPVIHGGGQEGGLRPGTLPVPLCVGFGRAAEITASEYYEIAERLSKLENRLWRGINSFAPNVKLNGHTTQRAPGCLNIFFPDCNADTLIDSWTGLDVAKGSACEATKTRSSHVLRAMGVSLSKADASIRLSIGRSTTQSDIDGVISIIRHSLTNKFG